LLALDPASPDQEDSLTALNRRLVDGTESVVAYAMKHPDLFTIPCIVFVCEEDIGRWTFTVAMNARVAVNASFG
jgi:hypothetical protein